MLSFIGITSAFVLIGVPLLAIILRVVRLIFQVRLSRHFNRGMWAFWGLNIVSLFLTISILGRNFNYSNHQETQLDLDSSSDTLRIELLGSEWEPSLIQVGHLQLDEDRLIDENIELNIVKSDDEQFHLVQRKRSRGKGRAEAEKLAQRIDYQPIIKKGVVQLPRYFIIPKGEAWRFQGVEYVLKVPKGKSVYLGKEAGRLIHRFELDRDMDHPWGYSGHMWKMDEKGLVCPNYVSRNNHDEEYQHSEFKNLIVEGRMKVEIEQGDEYRVRLTGREVYTKKVDMVQHYQTLTVSTDLKRTNSPIRLYITMPVLDKLHTENTDDVKIQGFRQPNMTIKHEGVHDYKIFADIDTLTIRQLGKSEVDLRGRGKLLKAFLEKRAHLDAEHFTVDDAEITATDHSRASLSVVNSLVKRIDDNCRIDLDGEPKILESLLEQENIGER